MEKARTLENGIQIECIALSTLLVGAHDQKIALNVQKELKQILSPTMDYKPYELRPGSAYL